MKNEKTGRSILYRVLTPLILLIVLQAALFVSAMLWSGMISRLNHNALDILTERVNNRKNDLAFDMVNRWSNLTDGHYEINLHVEKTLRESQAQYTDLTADAALSVRVLEKLSDPLINLLRGNSVTGAFIILQGQETSDAKSQTCSGLYIRDMEPSSRLEDDSDLLLERAPIALCKKMGIPMDIYWTPRFSLEAQDTYYYNPYLAAQTYRGEAPKNLGYWGGPHRIGEDGPEVITYSEPLLTEEGVAYGVLGIDITVDHLRAMLPYGELYADQSAAYLLAIHRGEQGEDLLVSNVLASGPDVKSYFDKTDTSTFKREGDHPDIYRMIEEIPEHGKCMASVQPIDLYNSHTPFEQERWMLIGIMEETSLFGFTHRIIRTIWFVAGIVLLLGVIGAAFTGYRLVRPITALAQALRQSDPHQPVKLEKTHITEIDQLSSAIEHSSYAVADAASRLAHIIEMADIPIGAFEHEAGARTVYCTNSFFKKLQDWPIDTEETFCQVPCEAFDAWLICFRKNKVETIEADGTTIYRVGPSKTTPSRWIRVKTMEKDNVTLGVLVDVTMERMEKQKIEYERDYDLLTNLLNRRAFQQQAERLLENTSEIKTAALVMLDLDNLKYINDTYGHDSGDAYIRCAADAMRSCKNAHTLVARMSGDEFFVFFTGFENRSVARKEIDRLRDGMMGTGLLLPDGERVRVRASAGVAWYPKDAQTLSELIRFADFAMYQVKNTTKGSVQDFDQTLYERDAFLLQSKEDLNRMIEEELVDYAFQPIVDAQTGETFAYEALMRPRPHALCIPLDVLRIARSQAMLYRIERLTWFKAMETYIKHEQEMKRCRIFINSISNQHLDDQDTEIFDQQFEAYLDRIVIELTEGEHADDLCIAEKKLRCRRYDAAIALDDFGTGFNGEVTLLRLVPDYIKMDINIVHGIDHDETRQEIFRNLVLFSKQRNIKVVAEGVENEAEMRTLVELGVDYMQGFFFGKPQLEPQHAILEAVETLLRVRRKIEQANGCE